jgi:AAA+ superfamily predicted ATPase
MASNGYYFCPPPMYNPYAHIHFLETQLMSLNMVLNNTMCKIGEMEKQMGNFDNDIKNLQKLNDVLSTKNKQQYNEIKYLKRQLNKQTQVTDNSNAVSKSKPDIKKTKKKEVTDNEEKEISNIVDNIMENIFSPNKKNNPNGIMTSSFVIDMKTGKIIDTTKKDNNKTPTQNSPSKGPTISKGPFPFNPFSMIFGGMKKKEQENINNDEQDGDTQYDFSTLDKYEVEKIDTELNNISDLIKLGNTFMNKEKNLTTVLKKVDGIHEFNGKYYGINIETLIKLIKPLEKLNNMIGLEKIKSQILEMILYYMQEFEKGTSNMLHTIIEGPPGVGKTELGKIFAEIYSGLGIIPSNKFKLVKRTDLIGEYVGHTGRKTQDAIDEAEGGVLFIDEAYSLGGVSEKSDTYSKECIDVLNQNLSENKKKLIVIIAGYKDQLETSFFSYNPGLKRRFPFKYTIEGYTPEEIKNIYIKKLNDIKWKLDTNVDDKYLVSFFTKNKDNFKNFGGDIENFILNSKFVHSKRVFKEHPSTRKKLNISDFENAFERFQNNKKVIENTVPIGMYA